MTDDPFASRDQTRALLADFDPDRRLLTDEQVKAYLDLNGGRPRRAAADALDAIAVSELLASKVIRTQDLQTDGAKISAELRARAALLRQQDADETDDADQVFDVVPVGTQRRPAPEHTEHVVWGL